jgi:hypothetical protein
MEHREMVQTILNILEEFVRLQQEENGISLEIVREGTCLEIAEEKIKRFEPNIIAEKLIGLLLHNNRRKIKEIRWKLAEYYKINGFPAAQVWRRFVIVPIVNNFYVVILVDTD